MIPKWALLPFLSFFQEGKERSKVPLLPPLHGLDSVIVFFALSEEEEKRIFKILFFEGSAAS